MYHLKWRPMLWLMRERKLCEQLHVCVVSDTQKIQSTDWPKWCCGLGLYVISHLSWFKHHFRWSDKQAVDTSIAEVWKNYAYGIFEVKSHVYAFYSHKNELIWACANFKDLSKKEIGKVSYIQHFILSCTQTIYFLFCSLCDIKFEYV